MQITLKQLRESAGALGKLGNAAGLPVKKAYWLGRLIDQVEAPLNTLEKRRQAMIKELSPGDGQPWPDDTIEKFEAQFEELMGERIDLPDVQFTLDEIAKADLSAIEMRVLRYLLTAPTEGEDANG